MTEVGPATIVEGLAAVQGRIADACARCGRDPSEVRLVAVSKTFPAERVRMLLSAGHALVGESRVQEARAKMEQVGPGATWHLVGHLQRNKARAAVGAFELIHSVDDEALAQELDRRAAARGIRQSILIQHNLSHEVTKHGLSADGLPDLVDRVSGMEHLDLRGLMTIPPPVERPEQNRVWFRRLLESRDREAARTGRQLPELSMGMTDDFEVAIEEGATLVRVGRAIFGPRTPPVGS